MTVVAGAAAGTRQDDLLLIDQSGARELVGYHSQMTDDNTGICSLEIGPQHLNRLGLLHGGFVSLLLDNGCGVAVRSVLDNLETQAVTIALSVNFILGVGSGKVSAIGRVTGGGRSLKFAEAELRDDAGRLVATGSATFRIFEAK